MVGITSWVSFFNSGDCLFCIIALKAGFVCAASEIKVQMSLSHPKVPWIRLGTVTLQCIQMRRVIRGMGSVCQRWIDSSCLRYPYHMELSYVECAPEKEICKTDSLESFRLALQAEVPYEIKIKLISWKGWSWKYCPLSKCVIYSSCNK